MALKREEPIKPKVIKPNSDRKSVVQGKSVDLGGRRIIKKKKEKKKCQFKSNEVTKSKKTKRMRHETTKATTT